MSGYVPGMTDEALAGYFGPPPPVINASPTVIGPDVPPVINAAPTSIDVGPYQPTAGWNPTEQSDADAAKFMGPGAGASQPFATMDLANHFGPPPAAKEAPNYWGGPDPVAAFRTGLNGGTPGAVRQPTSFERGPGGPTAPPRAGGGGPAASGEAAKLFKAELGTYDAQKAALQMGADAEKGKADTLAAGGADIARQKQDESHIQQAEAQEAARHFADYSAETQRQIDEVRAKKIDPNRAYADTGSKVTAVIGGLLGGLYQGLNHMEKNPFIEQMNKVIDRDIAAQETDLRTQKEAIGERRGLLGEMRATYKDEALAKAQAKNLYLEGAKEAVLAQGATFESPTIQARANDGAAQLTRMQAELGLKKLKEEAAARNAAAGAENARKELLWKHQMENRKANREDRETDIKAGELDLKMGKGADGAMTPEQRGKIAQEIKQTQTASDEFNRQIDRMQSHPIITDTGVIDSAFAHLPQRVAPDSNDAKQQLEAMNTQMLQAIGKVAKDADGKPNKAMIEKLEERFSIHLDDTPRMKQQKLAGLRSAVNALAREEGADAPEPNSRNNLGLPEFNLDGTPKQ